MGTDSYEITRDVLRPLIMVFHVIAIVPTIFRLYYRSHISRLGWDDFWAFYAMLWILLLLIIFSITSTTTRDFGITFLNFSYIGSILATIHAVWGARINVAVTIVRLLATGTTRIVAKFVAGLFAVFAIASMTQVMLVCGSPLTAKFLCSDPSIPGYFQLTITLIGDLWLIALPACEILVTGIGIARSILVIRKNYIGQALTSQFEVSVSLIICNLLFLVTYIYRIYHTGEEESAASESKTETPRRPPTGIPDTPQSSALTTSFVSTGWTTSVNTFAEIDERGRAVVSEPATREAFQTQTVVRDNLFVNHSVS